jgi:Brp/Blh family beta-carotene 15,15'-monooxygenase
LILHNKIYQITIILTILLILLGFSLNSSFTDLTALFFILTAGIIHGANDIRLLQKKYQNTQFNFFIMLLILYVFVVVAGAILFFYVPSAALIFFILFSSFHFGQQHWSSYLNRKNKESFLKQLGYTVYGLLVFGLLFSLQSLDVSFVIENITGKVIPEYIYYYSAVFLILSHFILSIFLPVSFKVFVKELIVLLLLAVLFGTTSLLFSFGVYFVFWHSIPSIREQLIYLDGEVSLRTVKGYVRSSLVYWLFSLIGLFLFYYYLDLDSEYFVPLFFTFLAAITFPHTVVIGMLKTE